MLCRARGDIGRSQAQDGPFDRFVARQPAELEAIRLTAVEAMGELEVGRARAFRIAHGEGDPPAGIGGLLKGDIGLESEVALRRRWEQDL